jgi:hypothetical protein
MNSNTHFWSYLVQFFLEWEIFQTKVVEKIKTHILCSVTFFRKSCRLWDNVGKYCRVGSGHRWQYGARELHAGYLRLQIHPLRMYNSHCFPTAAMVARMRLNITLYMYIAVSFISYRRTFTEQSAINYIYHQTKRWKLILKTHNSQLFKNANLKYGTQNTNFRCFFIH